MVWLEGLVPWAIFLLSARRVLWALLVLVTTQPAAF